MRTAASIARSEISESSRLQNCAASSLVTASRSDSEAQPREKKSSGKAGTRLGGTQVFAYQPSAGPARDLFMTVPDGVYL